MIAQALQLAEEVSLVFLLSSLQSSFLLCCGAGVLRECLSFVIACDLYRLDHR